VSERANKEIAHLTETRLQRAANKDWPVIDIAKETDAAFSKFMALVPAGTMISVWVEFYLANSEDLRRNFQPPSPTPPAAARVATYGVVKTAGTSGPITSGLDPADLKRGLTFWPYASTASDPS
jgi:hypothetical protein